MTLLQTLPIVVAIAVTGVACVWWRRRSEVRDLERALYPEVVSLRQQAGALAAELARRQAEGRGLDPAFFARWRLSAPLVYPAAAGGLGRLPGEGVDRVGYFHAQLAEARSRLAEARAADGVLASSYRLLSNLVRACNHVDRWTSALEPRLGRPLTGYADLAAANRLLEVLEQAGGEPMALPWCWADTAFEPD
ncbi:MAG: hypothetical protein QM608_12050 [Caulobacter sp.]